MTFNRYLNNLLSCFYVKHTENQIKFSAEDFFSKCEQTVNYSFSHITKEIFDEKSFFCAKTNVTTRAYLVCKILFMESTRECSCTCMCIWNVYENLGAATRVSGIRDASGYSGYTVTRYTPIVGCKLRTRCFRFKFLKNELNEINAFRHLIGFLGNRPYFKRHWSHRKY